jgi:hypothetical protein
MEMTNMTFQQLEDLCIELVQSDCDRSESLAAFSDAELQDVYVSVLRQFGLELAIGVDEHSHWMSDSLLIYSNQGPIHLCQTAFYAVLCELDRRGVRPDGGER